MSTGPVCFYVKIYEQKYFYNLKSSNSYIVVASGRGFFTPYCCMYAATVANVGGVSFGPARY
jgi:hypothetical protein